MEWVLEIFKILIMLLVQNRFGGYYIIKILYFIRSLVQNISLIVAFWKRRFIHIVLLLGGVFYKRGMSSIKVWCGEWGMENLSKIWEHKWLPKLSKSKVVSPRTDTDVIFMKDLFLAGRRVWDPGLVQQLFLPWEADLIRRIPMCEESIADLLIWPLTPTGDYSVQSAYRMLESTARCVNPGSSLVDGQSKVWKGIWKIKTPNQIRHFIWRAARDSLPTKQNI